MCGDLATACQQRGACGELGTNVGELLVHAVHDALADVGCFGNGRISLIRVGHVERKMRGQQEFNGSGSR
jgi:hypothetical protein